VFASPVFGKPVVDTAVDVAPVVAEAPAVVVAPAIVIPDVLGGFGGGFGTLMSLVATIWKLCSTGGFVEA
jgi:hypothetical protein